MSNRRIRTFQGHLLVRSFAVLGAAALPFTQASSAKAQSSAIQVSFQPASFPVQSGFIGDFGQTFGERGSGLRYGWDRDHTGRTFAYSPLPGWERTWGAAWSLIHMLPGPSTRWEISLSNGRYEVTILAAGYRCQGTLQQIAVEGELVVDGVAGTDYDPYEGGTRTITLTDGRLTVTNGPTARENCIDYIKILPR